ncbi:CUB domain-containing protein 1-like isoform X2 [Sinocyclocheilus anshuiensis]|uniref:CUB domain-containing protein 1-like n=1 Tax=Sinocyclocheilus anshuiensis TaxID=1608454 RepID=A0A671PD71_9TELE|nr:PREDICTED: CUB domain-containing protein 1-like isoform X1 [Sinocyclocheilus anshuiensis]XP_016342312.1 PREDICTED: CUB domain-containing protein 1-like isoform X2 [Sinocyclocheilus anshuiensis]
MRIWRFTCFSLLFGFFLSSVPELTGSAELKIAVEFGTTIRINTSAGKNPQCKVCIRPNTQQLCQSSVVLRSDTLLDFSCSQPENVFTVQIIRDNVIYNIEPKEHKALQKFNRTFIWNLKPPATKSLHLNFSSTGLRQIQPTDSCPDVYMLAVENVSIGRFCQNGTIRQVDVRNAGKLSLEVSGGRALDKKFIGVSLGRLINSLANFHVVLPEKSSTQDFFAPNAFPENAETMWYFTVPQTYYTDVHILSYTVPTCLQPENIPTMKYTWQGKEPLVKLMNVSQPSVEPGNFNLSIKNCKMSGPQPPSQGLMVHFQISAIKRSKGQCEGDLPEKQVLQIHVKKKDPKSACVLKLDSVIMDTITIASGNHFVLNSFDCNKDEVELTVSQTIECKEWRDCASTSFPLTFNYEQQCIPGVLKTIIWLLHGPQNSAVGLQSPAGDLRYCPPEDKCNSIILLNVSHVNSGITLGQFCPKGTIQKIQIRESKIAITASVTSFSDRNLATKPVLTYSFTQDISEHYIFTVAPKMDNPTVLATPAWPSGMKASSTVSWIVNLEPQFKSNLKFRNVSQPKCKEVHTNIAVQTIRSQTTLYSTKKDEKMKDLLVPESFYLNMTNCKSPTGAFRAMMEITLQNSTSKLLGIILSIVGVVLVIVTAVGIWFVLRKKKRNKAPPVSVYNPSEHAFLPGLHGIPKAQEEEEDPHTYVYIDETLVYSHLLKDDAEKEEYKEATTDESDPPLSAPALPVRNGENLVTKSNALFDNELCGYVQGQSTTSGSPKTSEEEGNYETRLCV